MVSRLLLGCGTVGSAVAEVIRERNGTLVAFGDDESRVAALREDGVAAEVGDVTDPAVLGAYDPDSVFVATEDPERTHQAAAAARDAFPGAYVVVYGVDDGRFADVADAVVDPGELVAGRVLDLVDGESGSDDAGVSARRFSQRLRSLEGPLAVVMHDNPDPDAIGSGVALAALARRAGLDATPCYFGEINHQENRALVNLLDLELRNFESADEVGAFGSVALVDHSRPGVNDQLPADLTVDVVVDHHPPRGPVEAGFVDLRHDVGATSTIFADYFARLGTAVDRAVATALLYGIRVDTADFTREVQEVDFEAAASLLTHADLDVLAKVEDPQVSPDTFEILAAAIRNRRVEGSVLTSYAGTVGDRDSLAQAADLLVGMTGIDTAVAFGTIDDTVYVSARARGADRDLGEAVRAAFDPIGSAGGHTEMAGAQIPLGSLTSLPSEDDRSHGEVVESVITERFLETVDTAPKPLEDPQSGTAAIPLEYAAGDEE